MAAGNAVWGIEVGQCALKAVRLRALDNGMVEVVGFDIIPHEKILSQPDADRDALIDASLKKFAARNELKGDGLILGVPGQQSFARFIRLPPADPKKINDLVRYEAEQQIPFDIEDVVWDYQVFNAPDSPDVEVGIFAIRKDLIRKHLDHLSANGLAPTAVQTIPSALYNFARFDGQAEEAEGATVIVDVGAQNTDLIIVEPYSAWTRNIPLGGNNFTDTLVRSFKLSFSRAEDLKRNAAASKYARQIFQTMRPVFTELVAEIQRSLGFYSASHRDVKLQKVLAVGNAFRLPGLQKYLENNLSLPGGVVRLESFKRAVPGTGVKADELSENVPALAAALGLALQGLNHAKISASLLPPELARIAVWKKKKLFFVAAAAGFGVMAAVPWGFNAMQAQALTSGKANDEIGRAVQIINTAKRFRNDFQQTSSDTGQKQKDLENLLELKKYEALLPRIYALVHEALPPPNPPALAAVRTPEEFREIVKAHPQIERSQRGLMFIDTLRIDYVPDVDAVNVNEPVDRMNLSGVSPGQPQQASQPPRAPGFVVRVEARLLYGKRAADAQLWLTTGTSPERPGYRERLRALAQRDGLGFYMPNENPTEIASANLLHFTSQLALMPFGAEARAPGAAPRLPGGLSGGLPSGPQVAGSAPPAPSGAPDGARPGVDPLTLEEQREDWRVSFAFKLRLGDMPKDGVNPATAPPG